jgi:hypothetical protein
MLIAHSTHQHLQASELTETLGKELVSEWVINNKLVLNTTKPKSIVFGSKYSLRLKPQLDLCIKGVTIEQVEEAELLRGTLDGQLSWSSHIDKVVVKMGRGMSVIKICNAFLTRR